MIRLRENIYNQVRLDEQGNEGIVRAHFSFLQGGIPLANGRVYEPSVLRDAIRAFSTKIKTRSAYGSDEHPKMGTLEVPDVATEIESVDWDDKNKIASATVKILPTSRGKDLLTILRAGGRLGVSARGTGESKQVEGHEQITTYELHGIDFCIAPNYQGALVSRENLFESADLDEEQEDSMYQKFAFACSPEGGSFRGSFSAYKEVHRPAAQPKGQDAASEAYQAACRQAGFKGSLADFKAAMGGLQETMVGKAEATLYEGQEEKENPYDWSTDEMTEEDRALFLDGLADDVKKAHGERLSVQSFDNKFIYCFDVDTSMPVAIPFLINGATGVVELTGQPTPIAEQ